MKKLYVFMLSMLLLTASAIGQTTITVGPNGEDYTTMQAAIAASSSGITTIANGNSASLSSQFINRPVTLVVVFEAGFQLHLSTINGYGFDILTDDISLKNFTFLPLAGSISKVYTLKINPSGITSLNNLTYKHLIIKGTYPAPFDIDGYNNVSQTNHIAINTQWGVGVAFSGTARATMMGVSTPQNARRIKYIYTSRYVKVQISVSLLTVLRSVFLVFNILLIGLRKRIPIVLHSNSIVNHSCIRWKIQSKKFIGMSIYLNYICRQLLNWFPNDC